MKSHRTCLSILGVSFVLLASFGVYAEDAWRGLPMAEPESVGMSSERLDRVGEAMQRYIDAGLVPGTVTLIARHGKIVHYEARGERWVEEGEAMQEDTIFRIASMTKPITSVALMTLFEEGRFLLTDPISKWLPEFRDMQVAVPTEGDGVDRSYRLEEAKRPITVKHVLTHTAGFANSYRGPHTQPLYQEASARQSEDETVADFVRRLATIPLNYHPGEKWQYSRATCVVGRLVEVISGQTLDEYLRERIFGPLGMNDSYFYLPEEKLDRFVAQYTPGEDDNKIELAGAPTADSRFVKEPHG